VTLFGDSRLSALAKRSLVCSPFGPKRASEAVSSFKNVMPGRVVGLFATLVFVFTAVAFTQVTQLSDGTAPPVHGVGHNYEGMLNETVNPSTGGLTVHIDIPVAPGRKLTVPLGFEYNSGQAWFLARRSQYAPSCVDINGQCPHPQGYAVNSAATGILTWGGWSTTFPQSTYQSYQQYEYAQVNNYSYPCQVDTAFMFKDPSGASHQLNLSHLNPSYTGACNGTSPKLVEADTANDAYYQASLLGFGYPSVVGPDGTVYDFFSGVPDGGGGSGLAALPYKIEDRNGNVVYVSTRSGLSVTDSVGRNEITISPGWGSVGTTAVSAAGESYSLTWQQVNPSGMPISVVPDSWSGAYGCISIPNVAGMDNPGVVLGSLGTYGVTAITLPNHQQYKFSYDPVTGFISKITYPSGGWVSYTWGKNPRSSGIGFNDQNGQVAACAYLYDTPAITQRKVSFDGSTIALQQTFTYATTWGTTNGGLPAGGTWSNKSTTVITSDLVAGTTSKTVYNYGWVPGPAPISYLADNQSGFTNQVAVESTVQHYGYSPSYPLLKTETKGWFSASNPPLLECAFETLDNGLASGKFYQYRPNYVFNGGQITDVKEFAFGQVAASACASSVGLPTLPTPVRETVTTYQTFANTPIYPSNPSILDRPASIQIFDGSSGSSVLVAETDTTYDETSIGSVSSLVAGTHDETNYPSTVASPRGNATTVTRKCPQTTCPGDSVTKYTYDETGQITSLKDPCGSGTCSDVTGTNHTTTFSYTDNFTVFSGGQNVACTTSCPGSANAFVTTITDPLGHSTSFSYDYNNGQLTNSTDANSQTTSYIYNDLLARPTQTNFPDGGQTQISYNDSAPSVTTCQLISGTAGASCDATHPPPGWKTILSSLDGLGHVVQTELVSDPDTATYTATQFDGLGRTYKSWNATRCLPPTTNCSTEPTWGYTTYAYDALGRSTTVTEPDGSQFTTTYSGNQTTISDGAGNQRISQSDALGRLMSVWEAPNATGYNYESDYQYDALNNLICAVQKGTDTTAFTNCASAPAIWRPRNFQYDSLSRLTSAGNPESGTITYNYDLNSNLAFKTSPLPNASAGTSTVTVNYTYDAVNRLTKKSYTGMTTPPNPTVQYGYDAVPLSGCSPAPPTLTDSKPIGRRTSMCDASGATSWAHDSMGRVLSEKRKLGPTGVPTTSYSYNFDGSLANLTDPLTGKVITYTIGGAGRPLSAVNGTLNYVTNATYAPFGGLASLVNGQATGFAGINTADTYNSQLQPIQHYVTTGTISSATLSQLQSLPCPTTTATIMSRSYNFAAGSSDNGNVQSITNCRDTTRSQNFQYDPLNRIKQGNSTGPQWGEAYTIDPWGNLKNRGQVSGKTNYEPLNCAPNGKNQLTTCYSYDIAGNLITNSPANYTYDAENRIVWTGGYSYLYDGDGNRVEKCTATQAQAGMCPSGATGTLYWRATSGETLVESDISPTNLQNEYIFFNGKRVARRDSASHVHYYFSDHLGSNAVVENATGAVCEQDIDYYPYGGVQNDYCSGTSVPQNYRFIGKERDAESSLDNFGARYYASSMGRFMTPDFGGPMPTSDPVPWADLNDPQTLNLYASVRNNPTSYSDEDGHTYHVCDEHHQNCSNVSDEQFAQMKKSAQQSGETWNNGNIYLQGELKGTYNQTDVDLNPNAQAVLSQPVLRYAQGTVDHYVAPILFGEMALATAGAIALEGGLTTLELGAEAEAEVTPSAGQLAQAERVVQQNGRKSAEKALRTLEKRLAEHEEKIRNATGHTSSMEREVQNFKQLIQAYKSAIGKM